MKSIMLVCAAGMSTSLLVTKMQKAAEARGLETDIFAISASEFEDTLEKKDIGVVLLGPQVKFKQKQLEAKLAGTNIPLDSINMQHYGMMNGEKVLEAALELMN
ncbi:phosphotransferase system lactose/cellobiose-specific IIB subunit [Niallia circulans]|uniref:PTS sugar transporter subunit IIB n=1 Tax=Niallia circulans TaxID=1397 RepID=UPI00077C5F02|nr:PTS sugar transporter subunit IIB [Niallia circulans]MDR4316594.1 PTS sugar transporter subunit IIB [Niallia circulans]MED3838229.1 PTS sugar transporter subunit IIB [Niallia circulans]MED4243704.1 PTS sugar transporter subunit IIB [Niallia circulans]MED4246096.1 PTS sugar transporter subunit IIB [Niallia circulans]QKH63244.1 PTS sugar transporter subunit IIB [Niallia circulans]